MGYTSPELEFLRTVFRAGVISNEYQRKTVDPDLPTSPCLLRYQTSNANPSEIFRGEMINNQVLFFSSDVTDKKKRGDVVRGRREGGHMKTSRGQVEDSATTSALKGGKILP